MKVTITIQHPAHVHFFKNTIKILENNGHNVDVFVRQKDISQQLLDEYGIDYTVLTSHDANLFRLAFIQAKYEYKLYKKVKEIKPDILMAIAEPGVAHVSKLIGAKSILFTDTEHATIINKLGLPFADIVSVPTCYQAGHEKDYNRYAGYHELAYLHPNYFTPNPEVLNIIGAKEDERLVVLRLNAWESSHDIGDQGFDSPKEVITHLENSGARVLLTSEPDVGSGLEKYSVDIPYSLMHDLIYYSDLLIGESATMAAESAVLGTPAIFISTSRRGYTDELGDRYGLVHTFSGVDRQQAGIQKAVSILENSTQEEWSKKREKMLQDKVDTTEHILELVNRSSRSNSGFLTN